METAQMFPVFGALHADDPQSVNTAVPGDAPKAGPSVVAFAKHPKMKRIPKKRRPQNPRQSGSFDRVFDCDQTSALEDIRKAILSVSCLLEWTSNSGNRAVDAIVAIGLSQELKVIAKDAAHLLADAAEVRAAGQVRP